MLQVGEVLVVSLNDYGYTTIRSYASDLGFSTGRKYTATRNREERTYTIKRIS